jgi:hypothetical protein
MVQDQRGGRQRLSYWARKLNHAERGNTYSADDLKALAIYDVLKYRRFYLEGCSTFLVTRVRSLVYMLCQPNNILNKRQARYLWDLQPFVGTMTLAYRNGAMSEANPLSRRPNFVSQTKVPLFCNGEVPSHSDLRRKSQPLLNDAYLNVMIALAFRLSLEFAHLMHEGYFQDSFHGDEGKWTKDSRIDAKDGCFCLALALHYLVLMYVRCS